MNFTKKFSWKWFQGYFTKISLNSLQPDLSRPPPGFGGPPPHMPPQQGRPAPFNDSNLIPTLPYHDLPAGLMVPLIKMEDSGYKPVDPKKLRYFHEKKFVKLISRINSFSWFRLPPPAPPTERLLAALEQFYAPPSHERPRDPEGWEMLGLYEWSRKKTAAIKKKADDIGMKKFFCEIDFTKKRPIWKMFLY